ncbi:class I adenylate-forming enzyme family protein [Streptomyces sp. NBC_00690]|uniref:class I adenylate-forming enzyme family protein n=1 Tax=Streptomyces sp. NBC_00690 TaxID=2975808 RepID=UPI002E2985A0|nr:AMP-binding protein [Streptomyces sp. NBC_00690]
MVNSPPTFAARWADTVAAVPERPFLIWEAPDGEVTTWTYRAFDALVGRVAGGLRERGVTRGTRVGIALPNCPAYVALWLALARLGAAMVCSDPSARAQEFAAQLRRTHAVLGFHGPGQAVEYHAAAAQTGTEAVEVELTASALTSLCGATSVTTVDAEPADLAGLMFTSGTTAEPKCVMITQANYAFAGDVMAAAAALRSTDRQFVVLPLFHANAQYYSFAPAISAGASVVLMPAFSASRLLNQAARHRVTHLSLFAAPIRMVLARGATPVPGLRIVHCWYAQNITDEQYERFAELIGCRPRQLYGMTETVPAVLTNRAVAPEPASMGLVTLGCRVQVRDPKTGAALAPGEEGEVFVGGRPGSSLFAGYLDAPHATAASYPFADGWFATGDRATVDEQGRFFFAGRRGDVLKVAGENVSLVEIESVIAEHPAVLEAAVVGEADPVRDEVPVAYVVRAPGSAPEALDDLPAWCTARLAKSKRPVRFEQVAELPRTSVGKIRKFKLSERSAT